MISLPETFSRNVRGAFGVAGQRWLVELPAVLAGYAQRWGLTFGAPYPLTYHYVVAATRADGTPAVLKLGVPNQEFGWEAETLRLVDGDGMCRLLAADVTGGAMLLERVEPGVRAMPRDAADDEATTAALLDVMRRLHRPVPPGTSLPTVADWGRAFAALRARHGGSTGPLPAAVIERAERSYAELAADPAGPPVLLHGDLHHENVLRSRRAGWLAIDPHGVAGEPAFEAGPLLLNPWADVLRWPDPARVQARRIDQLAEGLGVDADRVRQWGFAFAVLSAVWSDEAGGEPDGHALACAELLAAR